MEGDQEVYQGLFAGWEYKYFILFNSVLSFSQLKGSEVEGKIHLAVASINAMEQEPQKFTIFTGISTIQLCAPDKASKIKWIGILKDAKSKYFDKNLRDSQMTAISDDYLSLKKEKIDLDGVYDINPSVRNLLYGMELNIVNEKLASVWCLQAKMNEVLFSMKTQINNESSQQYNLTEFMEKYSNELKHNVTVICKIISEEREKLQKITLYVEKKYQKIESCIDQIDNQSTISNKNTMKPTLQGSQDDHYKSKFDKQKIFDQSQNLDETEFHSVKGANMSAFNDISSINKPTNKTSFYTMKEKPDKTTSILKKNDSYIPSGNEKATQFISSEYNPKDKCFQTDFLEVQNYIKSQETKGNPDPTRPGIFSNMTGYVRNKIYGSNNKTYPDILPSIDSVNNIKWTESIAEVKNLKSENKDKIVSKEPEQVKVQQKNDQKSSDKKTNENKPENTKPNEAKSTTQQTKEKSLEIAKKFCELRAQNKNDEAIKIAVKDIELESPNGVFNGADTVKAKWAEMDKNMPEISWGTEWTQISNTELFRTGSFTKMFMKFTVEQRLFLNEDGLIKKLRMKKL